jgi:hypothetical protein
MGKQTGLGDRFSVGGYDIGGDIGSLQQINGGPAALDITDITESAFERLGGERNGGMQFSSWFNKAAGRSHPVLSALPRTDVLALYGRGSSIGSPGAACLSVQVDYNLNRDSAGVLAFTTTVQSDGYGLEWGDQLTAWMRTDTSATNGSSLDGTASSSNGAQFYLACNTVAGTSVTVKIQDSADNSSWADLSGAAFTAVTAGTVSAQRIAVTGTVRRYLRAVSSGTFSTATFAVLAVRNATAVVF